MVLQQNFFITFLPAGKNQPAYKIDQFHKGFLLIRKDVFWKASPIEEPSFRRLLLWIHFPFCRFLPRRSFFNYLLLTWTGNDA